MLRSLSLHFSISFTFSCVCLFAFLLLLFVRYIHSYRCGLFLQLPLRSLSILCRWIARFSHSHSRMPIVRVYYVKPCSRCYIHFVAHTNTCRVVVCVWSFRETMLNHGSRWFPKKKNVFSSTRTQLGPNIDLVALFYSRVRKPIATLTNARTWGPSSTNKRTK